MPISTEAMLLDVRRHAATLLSMLEAGEIYGAEYYDLFQGLVDTGIVWRLQGSYQREAMRMIDAGLIVPTPATLDVA